MMKPLSLADASPAMADLVATLGWSPVRCEGQVGYAVHASIEKDGVILGWSSVKGESDYSVKLTSPVHPPIDPEIYRQPTLIRVLKEIGIGETGTNKIFLVTDLNLPRIKAYLSDAAIWERDIEAAIEKMTDKYHRWINGPDMTRNLARSLAERHPWLAKGNVPTPADFRTLDRTSAGRKGKIHSAVVLGAGGLGVLISYYLAH